MGFNTAFKGRKYSIIRPLYKRGDKMNISNYRSILLLTLFSIVFEGAMYSRFMGHLNINKILVEEHFGFRKNLTTEEAFYKLTNEILRALNDMSMVGGIFVTLKRLLILSVTRYSLS